jgi:hypothetical protein
MEQMSNANKGWLIVIAVGLSLVAIGAIADFLVRKHEIKRLHSRFLKLSEALTKISLREWQVIFARAGIKAVESFQKFAYAFVVFPIKFLDGVFKRLPLLKAHSQFFVAIFVCLFCVPHLPFRGNRIVLFYCIIGVGFIFSFLWKFPREHFHLFCLGTLLWCILFGLMNDLFKALNIANHLYWFYLPIMIIYLISGFTLPSFRILPHKYAYIASFFMNSLFISFVLSSIAMLYADFFIPRFSLQSNWFEYINESLAPKSFLSMLMLYCINFPFDLATMVAFLLLLRFVIKHKRFIGAVAVADIIISALLTVSLYSCLLMVAHNWDIPRFFYYFDQSLHWFKDVIVGIYKSSASNEPFEKHSAGLPDIHLIPILLTTFVPVVLYMSFFVLISFCKPVLKLAGRIFGAVGEKKESVFKQFGFLITTIMAAIKAIYDLLTL